MNDTAQYLTDQVRPHHASLLAAFQGESDAAAVALKAALDVRYGPHPRQTFDFFQSEAPWRGTLAYFHAGYWQARDKSQFRFLAPDFLIYGIDVAFINYPLCPDVDLPTLVEAARASLPALLKCAAGRGRGGTHVVAAGHSAGAHLSVELALTDWSVRGLPASPVAAVAALSGVYDLEPLVRTPLNDKLGLDTATARALSPIHRLRGGLPPALFVVGGDETPAFRQQNARMHEAWRRAGNASETLVVDGTDHFTLLRALPAPDGLARRIADLLG
ncbi:MAG TPA: alpha/beta hydrolase [Xanthobacteraceae bacterium]|nr:alpha/beta hydrolase [Xanthobacteraceae bacterium]